MAEYVLVCCTRPTLQKRFVDVLLILKDRPDWQKGRLNLPGGKVEPNESPKQTGLRELLEETGYIALDIEVMGVMRDGGHVIHCLRAACGHYYQEAKAREGETEKPLWLPWEEAMTDPRLMPNLRVIIPLCFCKISGWEIGDSARSDHGTEHGFTVKVPTYKET